ncbi:MAG TPA: serine/threonine-protein kinase, partial [Polyangiaceae bacterium]
MPDSTKHARANLEGLPRAGETFDGKYRIEGLLGAGGMGVVFAATHLRLGQRVAIKMLLPEWVGDEAVAQRFAREGRASVAVRSEHIVRVLDVDEAQGRPYLVLEYLEGEDLEEIIATRGALPIPTAVDLILQACEALAEVHASGVIHRDLKPANLFLTYRADGSPCLKVLDFGISKATARNSGFIEEGTQPLTVMGSPHYMSPEQMQSATDVDVRADLWSIGAILHELLAGKPPFEGESITALCAHVMTDPPPPLTRLRRDVPPALEGVVLRCLEKDRRRRYADVGELAHALASFGSDAARASAARIARVLEGGPGGSVRPPASLPREGLSPSPPTARNLVSDVSFPAGIHRPFGGYLLAAAFVGALVGGTAWKLHAQAAALHDAEQRAQGQT